MKFEIKKKLSTKSGKNSFGRAGVLKTAHGEIGTPAFVVVGTKGTVKALTPEQVEDTGAQVVLGNTYHLYLQPGDEIVKDAGGFGKMMHWNGPTMTDSGGFQVFSLGSAYGKDISKITKITDPSLMIPERFDDSDAPRLAKIGQDGVSFKSHLDGSIHYITPEKSIQIQHNLGADIIFAFDECTSPVEDLKYQIEALDRTHKWAKRSLKEHLRLSSLKFSAPAPFADPGEVAVGPSGTENSNDDSQNSINPKIQKETQANGLAGVGAPENRGPENETLSELTQEENNSLPALFGIVQGGREETLRKKSAKIISEMQIDGKSFDGFGIGGSFAKEDMSSAVKWVNEILPEDKPRHLLGIGEPEDLFMGIENGVDLFDCVLPTRLGRNGTLYTTEGKININNQKYRSDFSPVEKNCNCYTCRNYTRAYLSHLFHGKEMLAGTLGSIHNLYFIINLVKKIRVSILEDKFFELKEDFLKTYLPKS